MSAFLDGELRSVSSFVSQNLFINTLGTQVQTSGTYTLALTNILAQYIIAKQCNRRIVYTTRRIRRMLLAST